MAACRTMRAACAGPCLAHSSALVSRACPAHNAPHNPMQVATTRASFLFLHCTAPALAPASAQGQQGQPPAAEAAHASLTLHGHSRSDAQLGSLAALLAALLPSRHAAEPAQLRLLAISGFLRLTPAELDGGPQLATVSHLGLARFASGSSVEEGEAALEALLPQMPALQELDLGGWPGNSLPGCVAHTATALTKLALEDSELTSLPSGACPAGENVLRS